MFDELIKNMPVEFKDAFPELISELERGVVWRWNKDGGKMPLTQNNIACMHAMANSDAEFTVYAVIDDYRTILGCKVYTFLGYEENPETSYRRIIQDGPGFFIVSISGDDEMIHGVGFVPIVKGRLGGPVSGDFRFIGGDE